MLDVGAGGGTIAQWFARRVAPSGSVLAVDLDPRFIMALDEPNLEARQMDLFADDFPQDSFDVVHARCLLEHLPERVRGLERLIGAARPGGLVAVCDFGGELGGPVYPTPDDLLAQEVFFAVVNEAGWDHTWAPTIAEHMRQFGLEDVDAESFRRYSVGGDIGSVRINQFSIKRVARPNGGDRQGHSRSDRCVHLHASATPRWDTSALKHGMHGDGDPRKTRPSQPTTDGSGMASIRAGTCLCHGVPA